MAAVVIVGHDKALTNLLAAGLEGSKAVASCRTAQPGDDLAALAEGGHDTFVVTAETGGLPAVEAAASACAAVRAAARVILVSSAAVNEPNAHHPGLASEERLGSLRRGNRVAASWRELEDRARQALDGAAAVLTVLRPAALLVRGGQGFWSRLFAGKLAASVIGFDPTLQLLAGADLAAAVRRVIERRDSGGETYNVAPAGGIPLRKALRAARVWRLPAPYWKLWLVRKLAGAPVGQLDYLRYSWTVSAAKIRRRLDFEPALSSSDAIDALRGVEAPPQRAVQGRGRRAEPELDDFGMDKEYIGRLGKTLFRFLHDFWWRIEWKGLEHVPRRGRAVLAGVHRGHQPWDGVMTLHLMVRELGRYPRFLIHPTLVKFPFLAPYMIKCGGIHACRENAARVLERDGIVAIFPEGIRGAFTLYRDAYKLGRFGRDDYVKIALRHQAPIVPYVTVGSAEIFPIFGRVNWRWFKRYSEWPFLPLTPTMGTVPLPSKWHTAFLEPIHVEKRYPPEAADDVKVVRALSREVRGRMEAAIADMLARRKSIFYGSIFSAEERRGLGEEAA